MYFISIVLGIIIVFLIHIYNHRVINGPPGPIPLPIIGNFYLLDKLKPQVSFDRLYKKYGNIFSFYMGSVYTVVLNDKDIIKEALVDHSDVFSDRYITRLSYVVGQGRNVVFSNGEYWKKVRNIWSNAFTRSKVHSYNDMIKSHINDVITVLEEYSKLKKPISMKYYMRKLAFSVPFKLLFSREICYDSTPNELDELVEAIDNSINIFSNGDIGDFIPSLSILSNYDRMKKETETVERICKKFIKEHKDTIDRNNPRNFMDSFLIEVENDQSKLLDEISIVKNCNDFLIAGTDTVSTTLNWCIIFLANHQEVQDQIYKEVSEYVKNDADIKFVDLKNTLKYTNNFIKEVFRMRPTVPLSLPHKTNQDIVLKNYFIPKDTLILLNLYSASYSETHWKEPYLFNPNRHVENEKSVMVFSYGKRKCVGKNLAEITILLTVAMMVKKFKIERISDDLISGEICPGLTLDSLEYKVFLKSRTN